MKRLIALAAFGAALAHGPVAAETAPPVAVELFTSQGCYSCPPAEKYLTELADRPDVVALEWHVDYWDDLVYGSAGQWKDPFSMREATVRQYEYNGVLEGRRRAYTPQMIVAGRAGMVGSDRPKVERAIGQMKRAQGPARVKVMSGADGKLTVTSTGGEGKLWRVDFLREHVTKVLRGENKGKTLESRHIVRSKQLIGEAGVGAVTMDAPAAGHGCAILMQRNETAPILAAAYCTSPSGRS